MNVSQVVTLDKSLLIERAGRLAKSEFETVERALRLILSLSES